MIHRKFLNKIFGKLYLIGYPSPQCIQFRTYLPYLSETWPQKAELSIMPKKTTVVKKACLYWLTPHSQCKAGDKILKIMISMESAIQQRPVTKLRMIWNFPNPRALTAWVTVKESSGTTPEAAAEIWISAPEIQLMFQIKIQGDNFQTARLEHRKIWTFQDFFARFLVHSCTQHT